MQYDATTHDHCIALYCCRWTIVGKLAILPWSPSVKVSGTSVYTVSSDGQITEHIETWDSVDDQSPLSAEAILDLVR